MICGADLIQNAPVGALSGQEAGTSRDQHWRHASATSPRFGQLFPALSFAPAYKWAGAFGDTRDGLAFIGRLPGREREYHALGYGGNGITFSLIAARLITDLIVGRPNPDAEVFRFGR